MIATTRLLKYLSLAVISLALSSCDSLYTTKLITARTKIDDLGVKSYVVGVGHPNFLRKDMLSVFDSVFVDALDAEAAKRGWIKAKQAKTENAIIVLRLIEHTPVSQSYSYSMPTYGMVGGGTSTFNATTTIPSYNPITTTGSIYTAPTYQQTGSQSISGSYSLYGFSARIDCVTQTGQYLFEVNATIGKHSAITDKDRRLLIDRAIKAMNTNQEK